MLSNSSVAIICSSRCFLDRANLETEVLRPWAFLKPWEMVSIGGLSSSISIDKAMPTNLSFYLP